MRMCRQWGMTRTSERRAVCRQTEVTVGLWTCFLEWKELNWWGVQNNAGVKRIKGWNIYLVGEERQKGLTLLLFCLPTRKTHQMIVGGRKWESFLCKLSGTAGSRTAQQYILHILYESDIRYHVQEIPQMVPVASCISVTHLSTSFLPKIPLLSWSIFPLVFFSAQNLVCVFHSFSVC